MIARVIHRRAFLAGLGLSAGGLALGVMAPRRARAAGPSGAPGPWPSSEAVENSKPGLNPNVLVHVALDGMTTLVCTRSEMGQGVRSTIPVLLADEIGADMAKVRIEQAPGDEVFGDQDTDGSTSIRNFYDDLRRAGASVRMMLIDAAAKQWNVKPATCSAHDHVVEHLPTKRTLSFGELAGPASKLKPPKPSEIVLRPRSELRWMNSDALPHVDAPAIVDGSAKFGADVTMPGMLFAVICRPPVVGGTIVKLDAARALAVPGVKKVIRMPAPKKPWLFQPWGGVAVVADNTWAAMRGRAALDVTWEHGDNASYDSEAYQASLMASARAPGKLSRQVGDAEKALGAAARVLEGEYFVPHLAQLPMEPPCATAVVRDGRCEVWASTQNPQGARSEAAKTIGLTEDKITINVTLLGGGFGRKSKPDFVAEAAFVAREAGAPVRLQWTREDDVRHGYYNTVSAQKIRAGLDAQGKVIAWHHRTAFPPIATTFGGPDQPTAGDLQQGVLDLALDVPNIRAEACAGKAHVRVGWYRSVYNIFHAFAVGSMIDEIAAAKGADPRQVWLELIGPARKLSLEELGIEKLPNYGAPLETHPVDAGRLRNVVERVTALANWSGRGDQRRAFGLAAHRSFVAYTAVIVAVVPDARRKVRVDEAWIAMDSGTVVNKERVRAQMEGGVVMGISNAMFGGITFKGGAAEQANFRDARICRIGDAPRQVHVDLIESDAPPSGAGEPPVPPVGPALASAIFGLTGQRIREMPFAKALRA